MLQGFFENHQQINICAYSMEKQGEFSCSVRVFISWGFPVF